MSPQTDAQRATLASALETAKGLSKTLWRQKAEEPTYLPHSFVPMLVVWLILRFLSFGFFAPFDALALAALLICAASLAGAITLAVDVDRPFEGFSSTASQRWRRLQG